MKNQATHPVIKKRHAQKLMEKAKIELIADHVFWGSLCCRLSVKPGPVKTALVDGRNILYNPEYISQFERTDIPKLKGLLAKSALHLILGHHVRRGDRDQKLWQQAANLVTEAIIAQSNMQLPDMENIQANYADEIVEQVYEKLNKQKPQAQSGGNGGNQGQSDNQGQQPNESPNGDVGDMPNKDGSKPTHAEKQQEMDNWKQAVQQATNLAKSCGNLPGAIERMVEKIKESSHDWRELLRAYVEQCMLKSDYTWMRPNRRYLAHGIILPGLESGYEIMKACAYCDASGSIYQQELDQSAAEVTKILEDFPTVEFRVNYFDTSIKKHDEKIFTHEDLPIKFHTRAGGGTKFTPIFKDIEERIQNGEDEPKFVLIFTDLECSDFPKQPPDYPVIWCRLGKGQYSETPPFGEIIPINIIYD
jgi:predicted metal-dependent peptidase